MPKVLSALDQENERRQCRKSFEYFFVNYWTVQRPGRVTLVDDRPEQRESARAFQRERRIMIVKARQIGWSTLITAYLFWKSFFFSNNRCGALSKREDPEARDIVKNARIGYENLPDWMKRGGPRIKNRNTTKLVFDNGSSIESDASRGDPARGMTYALLVMDEFGKFPNPEEAWQSALPATAEGQLIVIGNPNGYGTMFWRQCEMAKRGVSDFFYMFFPWWVVPERDQAWYERETSSMTPAMAASEYCSDDVLCWNKSGSPVFDLEFWSNLPVQAPEAVGVLTPIGFKESPAGYCSVWNPPEKFGVYAIGADVASGAPDGDFSCAYVVELGSGRVMASVHLRCQTYEFAAILSDLGRLYNNAMVGIESNNMGVACISSLRGYKYPNIFRRREYNKVTKKVGDEWGFVTSRETKAVLVNDMEHFLKMGKVEVFDGELITEAMGFRYRADLTMGGSPNDDRVMAFGITLQVMKVLSPGGSQPAEAPEEEEDPKAVQFPFGKTWDEWEQWENKKNGSNPTSPSTTGVPARTFAALNSGARSSHSRSRLPATRAYLSTPRRAMTTSRRTVTRGRIT